MMYFSNYIYRQQVGKTVILYCNTSEIDTNKNTWTLNNVEVSNKQMYQFVLTEEKAGDNCCNIVYSDGDIRMSICYVECGPPESGDHDKILINLRTVIRSWTLSRI